MNTTMTWASFIVEESVPELLAPEILETFRVALLGDVELGRSNETQHLGTLNNIFDLSIHHTLVDVACFNCHFLDRA